MNEERKELRLRSRVHHGIKRKIKQATRATRHNIKEQLKEIAREESNEPERIY
jgi:hypothetical protein